jgi:hypothetical protein
MKILIQIKLFSTLPLIFFPNSASIYVYIADNFNFFAYIRNNKEIGSVRFEVFTAVTMKNGVFWDIKPCGSCKNRRFGGTWRLLHQGDKNR